jgi:cytochrome c oxidase cbb3-type subunit 2
MVRTLRFETERYGHYSLAGESVYDRPFQWGSKRTGRTLRAWAALFRTTGIACT